MRSIHLISDQFYNWSDTYETRGKTDPKTEISGRAPICAAGCDSQRVSNQTLQAMREGWVQVQRWAGAWAKVLSLGKLSREAPRNGLCPAGASEAGHNVFEKFPDCSKAPRADLQNQSETLATSRRLLRKVNGLLHLSTCSSRHDGYRHFSGQYDSVSVAGESPNTQTGGQAS